LDRSLKFAMYFLGQTVGLYGMDGIGFFAVRPAQPEVIPTIERRKLDRGLALVDGIIPSLFLVVDAAEQIVRFRVSRFCGKGQVEARNCIVRPARGEIGSDGIQRVVGN